MSWRSAPGNWCSCSSSSFVSIVGFHGKNDGQVCSVINDIVGFPVFVSKSPTSRVEGCTILMYHDQFKGIIYLALCSNAVKVSINKSPNITKTEAPIFRDQESALLFLFSICHIVLQVASPPVLQLDTLRSLRLIRRQMSTWNFIGPPPSTNLPLGRGKKRGRGRGGHGRSQGREEHSHLNNETPKEEPPIVKGKGLLEPGRSVLLGFIVPDPDCPPPSKTQKSSTTQQTQQTQTGRQPKGQQQSLGGKATTTTPPQQQSGSSKQQQQQANQPPPPPPIQQNLENRIRFLLRKSELAKESKSGFEEGRKRSKKEERKGGNKRGGGGGGDPRRSNKDDKKGNYSLTDFYSIDCPQIVCVVSQNDLDFQNALQHLPHHDFLTPHTKVKKDPCPWNEVWSPHSWENSSLWPSNDSSVSSSTIRFPTSAPTPESQIEGLTVDVQWHRENLPLNHFVFSLVECVLQQMGSSNQRPTCSAFMVTAASLCSFLSNLNRLKSGLGHVEKFSEDESQQQRVSPNEPLKRKQKYQLTCSCGLSQQIFLKENLGESFFESSYDSFDCCGKSGYVRRMEEWDTDLQWKAHIFDNVDTLLDNRGVLNQPGFLTGANVLISNFRGISFSSSSSLEKTKSSQYHIATTNSNASRPSHGGKGGKHHISHEGSRKDGKGGKEGRDGRDGREGRDGKEGKESKKREGKGRGQKGGRRKEKEKEKEHVFAPTDEEFPPLPGQSALLVQQQQQQYEKELQQPEQQEETEPEARETPQEEEVEEVPREEIFGPPLQISHERILKQRVLKIWGEVQLTQQEDQEEKQNEDNFQEKETHCDVVPSFFDHPREEVPGSIGFEYECRRGHRFLLTPLLVQTLSSSLSDGVGKSQKRSFLCSLPSFDESALLNGRGEIPLFFVCPCSLQWIPQYGARSPKESKKIEVGQLQRIFILNPDIEHSRAVLPMVQIFHGEEKKEIGNEDQNRELEGKTEKGVLGEEEKENEKGDGKLEVKKKEEEKEEKFEQKEEGILDEKEEKSDQKEEEEFEQKEEEKEEKIVKQEDESKEKGEDHSQYEKNLELEEQRDQKEEEEREKSVEFKPKKGSLSLPPSSFVCIRLPKLYPMTRAWFSAPLSRVAFLLPLFKNE